MTMAQVEVLRAACCVAGADKTVCEAEMTLLERLADDVGVGSVSLEAMIERGRDDPDFFEAQFRILSADPEATMKTLFKVAMADREVTGEEREMLRAFANRLGMSDRRFEQYQVAAANYLAEKKKGEGPGA